LRGLKPLPYSCSDREQTETILGPSYNELFLPESSDIRARETSSSTERETSDDPEQGYTRGGSDVDISADIECTIEELRWISQL
jgi:hypothetical protein